MKKSPQTLKIYPHCHSLGFHETWNSKPSPPLTIIQVPSLIQSMQFTYICRPSTIIYVAYPGPNPHLNFTNQSSVSLPLLFTPTSFDLESSVTPWPSITSPSALFFRPNNFVSHLIVLPLTTLLSLLLIFLSHCYFLRERKWKRRTEETGLREGKVNKEKGCG